MVYVCASSLRSEFLHRRAMVVGLLPPPQNSSQALRFPTPVQSLGHWHTTTCSGASRGFQGELPKGTVSLGVSVVAIATTE